MRPLRVSNQEAMHTPSANIIKLLSEVVPWLEESGIDYWLGRGVLRHWTLTKEIGDGQSDLDFHVWERDKNVLGKLQQFYSNYEFHTRSYKTTFTNRENQSQIEFMYLWKYPANPDLVYHERDHGKYKFYFPSECVQSFEIIEIDGIKVRTPVHIEKYISGLYGPDWRGDKKEDKNNNPFVNNPEMLVSYLNNFK